MNFCNEHVKTGGGQRAMHRHNRRGALVSILAAMTVLISPALSPAAAESGEGQASTDPISIERATHRGPVQRSAQTSGELRNLAEQADPTAQFLLGGLYSRGDGVLEDQELAVFWWRKAAVQGLAFAQNELGVAYAEGRGVSEDLKKAVEWFLLAAEQGLAVAQANLGLMYWNGRGVRRNEKRAVEWYRRAAEQGLGWAQIYLGDAYMLGRGVIPNKDQAVEWYRKAAEQDYPTAKYKLGVASRRRPPTGIAVRPEHPLEAYGEYWIAQAARSGYEPATVYLQAMTIPLPCSGVTLPAATPVRSQADENSSIIRRATEGEQACVLSQPPNFKRPLKDWSAAYLPEDHTVGFINTKGLRIRSAPVRFDINGFPVN